MQSKTKQPHHEVAACNEAVITLGSRTAVAAPWPPTSLLAKQGWSQPLDSPEDHPGGSEKAAFRAGPCLDILCCTVAAKGEPAFRPATSATPQSIPIQGLLKLPLLLASRGTP